MLRQLREARDGHALSVMHGGARLRLYRDKIYWEQRAPARLSLNPTVAVEKAMPAPSVAAVPPPGHIEHASATATGEVKRVAHLTWSGQEVWHLPQWHGSLVFVPTDEDDAGAHTVPAALLGTAALSARARTGGERMQRTVGSAARTLKNLFQEMGVPAWERDVPLIYLGDKLLYVPFLGVNGAVAQSLPPLRARSERRRLEWRPDLLIA
jgi:tRNA(Ile)-lysidine synthase